MRVPASDQFLSFARLFEQCVTVRVFECDDEARQRQVGEFAWNEAYTVAGVQQSKVTVARRMTRVMLAASGRGRKVDSGGGGRQRMLAGAGVFSVAVVCLVPERGARWPAGYATVSQW